MSPPKMSTDERAAQLYLSTASYLVHLQKEYSVLRNELQAEALAQYTRQLMTLFVDMPRSVEEALGVDGNEEGD